MGAERVIQDVIRTLSGGDRTERVYAIDATVISVNKASRTALVSAVGGRSRNEFTARLMSAVDDGILVVPAPGSTVSIILGDFTTPYITIYSEVDEIIFRGGNLGGLVKVNELTTKINNLESLVNDLASKFNSHVHPGVTTGAGVTGVTATQEGTVLTPTTADEIENKNITHG